MLGTRWVSAQSQTFSSGSTGADGALNITAPGLTYFDPATIPNHHAGDTIFNFTTINIAQGSTLRLDSRNLPGPVYWLATGDVNIAGTLDLTGQTGHNETGNRVDRVFSIAGAGGSAGDLAVALLFLRNPELGRVEAQRAPPLIMVRVATASSQEVNILFLWSVDLEEVASLYHRPLDVGEVLEGVQS